MRFINSSRRKAVKFFLKALVQSVRNGRIRPFCIDEGGLWFETKYSFSIYSNLKDRILELDVNATWEEMESNFILNNLKDESVFIDVGANIGYFSMLAAQQNARKVLAIEPIPKTYKILKMNISHNLFTDIIEPFNVALGSRRHTERFVSSLGPKSHLEYKVDNVHVNLPTENVDVVTLDDLIKSCSDIDRVDLVKVDIEGYEYAFLLGAEKTIKAFKPMILMEIEEHRLVKYNVTAKQVFTFMSDLGYNYLFVTEDSITKGSSFEEDLMKGRNFVFYACHHSPIY